MMYYLCLPKLLSGERVELMKVRSMIIPIPPKCIMGQQKFY